MSQEQPPRNSLPSLWEVNHGRSQAARARKHAHRLQKATEEFDAAMDDLARLRAAREIVKNGSVGEKIDEHEIDYVWTGSFMRLDKDEAPTVYAWAHKFAESARITYNVGEEDGEWDETRLAILALYAVRATDTTDDAVEKLASALTYEEPHCPKALREWSRVLRESERQWTNSK